MEAIGLLGGRIGRTGDVDFIRNKNMELELQLREAKNRIKKLEEEMTYLKGTTPPERKQSIRHPTEYEK